MLTVGVALAAGVLGLLLPKRSGPWGFAGAAAALFALHVALNALMGFAGASIEESLLLFNGSYLAYLGFNLQITYRAFALPLIALALPFIFRLSR